MEVWVGLIGAIAAVAGAGVAFAGQFFVSKAERQAAQRETVLGHCVELIALAHDYRNRLWEERHLGVSDSVRQWDLNAYRRNEAALRLLTNDDHLHAKLESLGEAGRRLGAFWRLEGPNCDQDELDQRWKHHHVAIQDFKAAANKRISAG
jgi:hypothetical protein